MAYSDDFIEKLLNVKKLAEAREVVKNYVPNSFTLGESGKLKKSGNFQLGEGSSLKYQNTAKAKNLPVPYKQNQVGQVSKKVSSSSQEINDLFGKTKDIKSTLSSSGEQFKNVKGFLNKAGKGLSKISKGGLGAGALTLCAMYLYDKMKDKEEQESGGKTQGLDILSYENKQPQTKQSDKQTSQESVPSGLDSIGNLINARSGLSGDIPPIEDISLEGVKGKASNILSQGQGASGQINREEWDKVLDNILSLKQMSAQQRQDIYQPQLDYLQRYIDEYNKASEWQARQSAIASGLAGFAGNQSIYQNAIANDPRKQMAGLVDLLGKQAQLKDELRFDPSQIQLDAQLAMSSGMSPLLATGSKDVLNAIATSNKLNNSNELAMLKLAYDIQQANQNQRQQRFDNLVKLADLALKQNKIDAKAVDSLKSSLRDLQDIKSMILANPKSIGLVKSMLGGKILNRVDSNPQHIMTRTMIDNFRTNFRHALTGANFSVREIAEYDRFMPNISDNAQIALPKIDALERKFYNDLRAKGLID